MLMSWATRRHLVTPTSYPHGSGVILYGTSGAFSHACAPYQAHAGDLVEVGNAATIVTPTSYPTLTPSHGGGVILYSTSIAVSHACVPHQAHANELVEVGNAVAPTSYPTRTPSHVSGVIPSGTSSASSHAYTPHQVHANEVGNSATSRHPHLLSPTHTLSWRWCDTLRHQ